MKIKFGDKLVDVDMKDGIPVIKATSKEIKHKNGRVDVQVFIPCLRIKQSIINK